MRSFLLRVYNCRQYFLNTLLYKGKFLSNRSVNPIKIVYTAKQIEQSSFVLRRRLDVFALSFLGLFTKNETPEDKLIATIKRSVLCIQRGQYDRAEQTLHLALKIAQDIQSRDGVTYVYDVMANLAMEREQLRKAEQLFAVVLQRLLGEGVSEDDPKILHISSKISYIALLEGDLRKSKAGFVWTLARIEERIKKVPDDMDVKELYGLTRNWFGQLLMEENNFAQAKRCFKDAYDCFVQIHGTANEEVVTILNNLGVVCLNMDNFGEAKGYILEAIKLVERIKDTSQEAILKANLGLIFLREGLINEAKVSCAHAWKTAKSINNNSGLEQAEYCLSEIKMYKERN